MFIGIDQSKRSTAAVGIGRDGGLKHFALISPPMAVDGEYLLVYQWDELKYFLAECGVYHEKIDGIAMEGLSFNAVGSGKDMLAGLFWYLRTMLYLERYLVGVIPVTAWRSKVISAAERKTLTGGKDAIKRATVAKLPFEVRVKFEQYVRERKAKPSSIYDLADAYFIAQYRLSLEEA